MNNIKFKISWTDCRRCFFKNARLKARNVNVFYGNNKAIDNVTIDIGSKEVISFIGPSGVEVNIP